MILQSVQYVNYICFWRGCASHVKGCALVSKQTCLACLSFNLTECSISEKICYFLIAIASIIHWQFCRYQLGIIQGKWDQLQLDNELPHKTLEELTGDFFFCLKLVNVSSVMTDIKHSITKNVHKLRVNLDKEQSEVCPNTHKDMPETGGKKTWKVLL